MAIRAKLYLYDSLIHMKRRKICAVRSSYLEQRMYVLCISTLYCHFSRCFFLSTVEAGNNFLFKFQWIIVVVTPLPSYCKRLPPIFTRFTHMPISAPTVVDLPDSFRDYGSSHFPVNLWASKSREHLENVLQKVVQNYTAIDQESGGSYSLCWVPQLRQKKILAFGIVTHGSIGRPERVLFRF